MKSPTHKRKAIISVSPDDSERNIYSSSSSKEEVCALRSLHIDTTFPPFISSPSSVGSNSSAISTFSDAPEETHRKPLKKRVVVQPVNNHSAEQSALIPLQAYTGSVTGILTSSINDITQEIKQRNQAILSPLAAHLSRAASIYNSPLSRSSQNTAAQVQTQNTADNNNADDNQKQTRLSSI